MIEDIKQKSAEEILRIIKCLKKDQLVEVIHRNIDYTQEEESTIINLVTKDCGYFKKYQPLNHEGSLGILNLYRNEVKKHDVASDDKTTHFTDYTINLECIIDLRTFSPE